jgi:serine/threonine-protein kinase
VTLLVGAGPQTVKIPDVTNKDQQTATNTLQAAGFQVTTSQENSNSIAQGNVIRTEPAAGTPNAQGSTVNLVISAGSGQVQVPDVHGQDPGSAGSALGALGLKTKTAYETSASIPQGSVTRTDPPAGTSVAKAATVTIYVSTGIPTTTTSSTSTTSTSTTAATTAVPNVVGMMQSKAQMQLTNHGFAPNPQTLPTGSCPSGQSGRVASQDPVGNTQATQGSTVQIFVCP